MTDKDFGPNRQGDLPTELVARLEAISAAFESPAPWCVAALSGGVRHLQRNCEVMEDYQEEASEEDKGGNLPGRYDGEPLAQLRNLLPDIIMTLRATTASAVGTDERSEEVNQNIQVIP